MSAAVRAVGDTVRCPTCGERFPADYVVCPHDATALGVTPDPADPLIGTVLAGAYRITRVLAKGGMGRLYEAEHTRLPRRLAAKVIHDIYAKHPDAVARFEREARAVALVDCAHVVGIIDVVRTEDDRPCIVYERLLGEDLKERLDRVGRLPWPEAVRIAAEMCRGLASAHATGIVHRDLKPSNVFLATQSRGGTTVKLLDFGVAKLAGASELTRAGAIIGTPAYMAPEQARGASSVDARADLYGVGAVLYRMLSGVGPFPADDAASCLARLLYETAQPIRELAPDIPEEVAEVVAHAMARDPLARPADAHALEAELAALLPEASTRVERGTSSSVEVGAAEVPAHHARALARASRAVDESGTHSLDTSLGASAESTIVTARGSVVAAADAMGRLRRERPRLVLAIALCSSSLTLATALLVSGTTLTARHALRTTPIETWLVALAALTAGVWLGGRMVKSARTSWRDPARTTALLARVTRAARAIASTAGALTLTTVGASTIFTGAPTAAVSAWPVIAGVSLLAGLASLRFPRANNPRQRYERGALS